MRLTRSLASRLAPRGAAGEDGFTMMVALSMLLISGLLVAVAFTAAKGDIGLTRTATLQTKAYYAAVAGVQRYQHELTTNPNYWIECKSVGTESVPISVPATSDESYFFKTLASAGHSACESGKQPTILETSGAAKGTFRILSTGVAGSGSSRVKRSIVATFAHPGFTKYVYESNYEVEDPTNFSPEPTGCEHYYAYRLANNLTGTCPPIEFAPADKVNGPMHTNDAAEVCASGGSAPTFGRNSQDSIEMNGGHYAAGGCSNEPNIVGKYTESAGTLLPPETDAELLETAGLKLTGRTELVLNTGTPNTITYTHKPGETPTTVNFPTNGVVYVENSSGGCGIAKYTPFGSDTENDAGCGNVYVHGSYTESLTIASANDVIVNGNLTTTAEASGEPTGGGTLGLIAQNFVRVYHPVKAGYTTSHTEPATEAPHNGKCVGPKELSAKVLRSSGVSEITTTGLAVGEEVEGTVAGQIEAGTTISSLKEAEKKLILSKVAKPAAKELSAKITSNSQEVTGVSTTGLAVGDEVEGTVANQLEAGTTISELKPPEKLKLNKVAKKSETTKLKFYGETTKLKIYVPTGYEYNSNRSLCHKVESGYSEYREAENLYIVSCESNTTYTSNGLCKYENSSSGCSSKATNLNATEDPNHWGSLENPVIDAAILSTKHSWIVDNYKCGAALGKLNVWGSIAQFWRGPVGTSGGGGTGYIKNYNYDERLASQQPPSFLNPSSTSWSLSRETAPPAGFTG
jgi:Tfp pilus assembly protein PilX